MNKYLLGTAILLASANVSASGFYVGAHVGKAKNDDFCSAEFYGYADSCEDEGSSKKLNVGYQFNDYIAIDLANIDTGDLEASNAYNTTFSDGFIIRGDGSVSVNAKGWNLSLIGSFVVAERVMFFAKAGLFAWDSDLIENWDQTYGYPNSLTHVNGSDTFSESGNSNTFGFGIKFFISDSIAVVLEQQQFDKIEVTSDDGTLETDVELQTLGLQYTF